MRPAIGLRVCLFAEGQSSHSCVHTAIDLLFACICLYILPVCVRLSLSLFEFCTAYWPHSDQLVASTEWQQTNFSVTSDGRTLNAGLLIRASDDKFDVKLNHIPLHGRWWSASDYLRLRQQHDAMICESSSTISLFTETQTHHRRPERETETDTGEQIVGHADIHEPMRQMNCRVGLWPAAAVGRWLRY